MLQVAAASGGGGKPVSGKSKGKGKGAAANAVDAIEIPSEPNVAVSIGVIMFSVCVNLKLRYM